MGTSRVVASGSDPVGSPALDRWGIGRLITVLVVTSAMAALFFVAAGTTRVERAWVYYGALVAFLAASTMAMLTYFPEVAELVNARGQPHARDVKAWDRVFAVLYTALILAQPVVAGLDSVRWRASEVPHWLLLPGVAVTLLAYGLAQWALVANKHAETGVRIQTERHHQVVSGGPYRFVRHPLYAALLVIQFVYPTTIGSLWAIAPSLVIVALFVWRTAREDETLTRELPGYAEYAARVRWRLVPHVW